MTGHPDTDADARATRLEQVLGGLFRLLAPTLRRAIRAGLPAGPNVLLTVPGRRTGRPRRVPVAMLELGDARYVQASFGDVDWVRNLRAARRAVITRRGGSEAVNARELPTEEAATLLRSTLAPYHRSRLVRRVLGPRVRPPAAILHRYRFRIDETADEYRAEASRHPLFQLTPAPAEVGSG